MSSVFWVSSWEICGVICLGIYSYHVLSGPKLCRCPANFRVVVAKCQKVRIQRTPVLFPHRSYRRERGEGKEVSKHFTYFISLNPQSKRGWKDTDARLLILTQLISGCGDTVLNPYPGVFGSQIVLTIVKWVWLQCYRDDTICTIPIYIFWWKRNYRVRNSYSLWFPSIKWKVLQYALG